MIWLQALKFALLSTDEQLAMWRGYFSDLELEPTARGRFHDLLHRRWQAGNVPEIINEERLMLWIEAQRLPAAELEEITAWEDHCIRACDPGCQEFWDRLEPEDRYENQWHRPE